MLCMMNTSQCGHFSRRQVLQSNCMHACGAFNTINFMRHSQRYIRQTTAETIARTQTNATKISLARRKDAQALLVDGQPASGSHDKRTSPTNPQPPTAPAIGSGGNKLSLRCCRCSPSRHATGIQKQNLTDQEMGVVSSLSVCERSDFFKTRW